MAAFGQRHKIIERLRGGAVVALPFGHRHLTLDRRLSQRHSRLRYPQGTGALRLPGGRLGPGRPACEKEESHREEHWPRQLLAEGMYEVGHGGADRWCGEHKIFVLGRIVTSPRTPSENRTGRLSPAGSDENPGAWVHWVSFPAGPNRLFTLWSATVDRPDPACRACGKDIRPAAAWRRRGAGGAVCRSGGAAG